jgi:hypothetical protein
MKFSIIAVLVTVASVASLPASPAAQSGAPVPATPMPDVPVLSDAMPFALERRDLTEAQKAAEELLYPLYRAKQMAQNAFFESPISERAARAPELRAAWEAYDIAQRNSGLSIKLDYFGSRDTAGLQQDTSEDPNAAQEAQSARARDDRFEKRYKEEKAAMEGK